MANGQVKGCSWPGPARSLPCEILQGARVATAFRRVGCVHIATTVSVTPAESLAPLKTTFQASEVKSVAGTRSHSLWSLALRLCRQI